MNNYLVSDARHPKHRIKPLLITMRSHPAETHLCISLPFHISCIASIAQKRSELGV